MNKFTNFIALLFLCSMAGIARDAQSEPVVYRFSPVNQWDIAKTAVYWNPIIKYVSERSGVELELKIGRTSADTTAFVLAKEVDFAFTNHLFSPARARLGWSVIGRRNGENLHGQIVVAQQSPLRSIADLQGLKIAFPGPEAFLAYKVTMSQLLRDGIKVSYTFAGNHNAAFAQLLAGKVDAVGANSHLVPGYTKSQGLPPLRVLWSSDPFPDLALMVSDRVPSAHVNAVKDAFLRMSQDPIGMEILNQSARSVQLTPTPIFVEANTGDYDGYRRFYRIAPLQLQ